MWRIQLNVPLLLCGERVLIWHRGGGRIDSLYQPYIDGEKEIAEINAEYRAPSVR